MNVCARCGRPLKNSESINKGYGPVCGKKLQAEFGKPIDNKIHVTSGQARRGDDIVMDRINGVPTVNVYQRMVRHSPDGFEWGYIGSGPSDLALNILLLYVDEKTAWELHTDFKNEFISKIHRNGGVISGEKIKSYITLHTKTIFDGH